MEISHNYEKHKAKDKKVQGLEGRSWQQSKPRLLRRGGIFKPWSVGVFGDEAISLRVWGLMPRLGTPLECPDVPRGETPKRTPNPMIIEVKTIIPHQRANTRDPSIETPPFLGRGGVI